MEITIKGQGFTLLGAKNPRYFMADKSVICLDCKFSHYERLEMTENEGYYPFIAQMSDPEPHGREIFQEAEKGTFGEIADFAIRNADIKTD
tara:strand:+ start:1461 stop:1733 length:273 start_codon:yes stop_codon:yes gene_type:complete